MLFVSDNSSVGHHSSKFLAICIVGYIISTRFLSEANIVEIALAKVYLQCLTHAFEIDDGAFGISSCGDVVDGLGVYHIFFGGLSCKCGNWYNMIIPVRVSGAETDEKVSFEDQNV